MQNDLVFIATFLGPLIIDLKQPDRNFYHHEVQQQQDESSIPKGGFLDNESTLFANCLLNNHNLDIIETKSGHVRNSLKFPRKIKDFCISKNTSEIFVICGGENNALVDSQIKDDYNCSFAYNGDECATDFTYDEIFIIRKTGYNEYQVEDYWDLPGEANRISINQISQQILIFGDKECWIYNIDNDHLKNNLKQRLFNI